MPSVDMSTPSVFMPANPYVTTQVVPGLPSGFVADSVSPRGTTITWLSSGIPSSIERPMRMAPSTDLMRNVVHACASGGTRVARAKVAAATKAMVRDIVIPSMEDYWLD